MVTSSTTDSSNPDDDKVFVSNTGQRISEKMVPMLSPSHITNLPKGQAFALLNGSTLYKLRMPLPAIDKDDIMPQSLQELTEYMRRNYHVVPNWWEGAFSEYTPSHDIAEAFQAITLNKAASVVNDELQYGDVDMPNEDEETDDEDNEQQHDDLLEDENDDGED